LWEKTPIVLEEERTLRIKASGRINLAVHHLVTAAEMHQKPRLGWVGPEGYQVETSYDKARENCLLNKAPWGSVLAAFSDRNLQQENVAPSVIEAIGPEGTIRGKGRLWLTINEAVIGPDDKSRACYVTNQKDLDEKWREGEQHETVEQKLAQFKYITEHDFRDVFYQDNVGDFLITIEIPRDAKLAPGR
jgi:hypothetical protein